MDKMMEPPRLLRRPLPPKVLPALTIQTPKSIKHDAELSLHHRAPTPAINRVLCNDVPGPSDNSNILSDAQPDHSHQQNEETQYGVSIKQKGPENFPSRKHLRKSSGTVLPCDESQYPPPPPPFTLEDIIAQSTHCSKPEIELLNKPILSHQHYTDMELLIAKLQISNQSKVHNVVLSGREIPETSKRIPHQQLLLEQEMTKREEEHSKNTEKSLHPMISSYKDQDHNNILATYCELALLESLVHGGKALSLKAYFVCKLPDLVPLQDTLTYINLSFNEFRLFPIQIYKLENLKVLKLRNNPITEIPFGIHNLKKLKTFVISFCLLSTLPPGLFLLKNLQTLDISYNGIFSISKDICNLRVLEFLNVEGNSLPALPCEALKLKLKHLRVFNNAMHPLFWRENSCIEPQKLTDLAALSFKKNSMHYYVKVIPKEAKQILDNFKLCDCCPGPLYGKGLLFIRPCEKIFGIRKLPFMFHACSPTCYKKFMSQTESLTEHLYGK